MKVIYQNADGSTITREMCEHFFCLAPARAYSKGVAVARVTYAGRTLAVCASDMVPLMEMIHNQGLAHTIEPIESEV